MHAKRRGWARHQQTRKSPLPELAFGLFSLLQILRFLDLFWPLRYIGRVRMRASRGSFIFANLLFLQDCLSVAICRVTDTVSLHPTIGRKPQIGPPRPSPPTLCTLPRERVLEADGDRTPGSPHSHFSLHPPLWIQRVVLNGKQFDMPVELLFFLQVLLI